MSTAFHALSKSLILDESEFTCPVCFDVMDNKIFQCKAGHCICPQCFDKLKTSNFKCPTCKIKFDTEPIRCLFIEKVYPCMVLKCKNQIHGCNFCGTHEERNEHLKVCKFKKVSCCKSGCKFSGTPKEYFIHWCTVHARPFECQMENALNTGKLSCVIVESFFENKNNAKWMEHDIVLIKNECLVMYTMTFCFDEACTSKNRLELKPRLITDDTKSCEILAGCKLSMWKSDGSFLIRTMNVIGLDHVNQNSFESNSSCDDVVYTRNVKKIKFEFFIKDKDEPCITPSTLALKRQRSTDNFVSKRKKEA